MSRQKSSALILSLIIAAVSAQADDIAPFSDEFEDASTFTDWQDLGALEGWQTPSYEAADINTTEPGRFNIVPGPNTWFGHLRGLLLFKEITGDFVVTLRVRAHSRHNPADPTEIPNGTFSLTGIFVHAPRPITQAAPSPYTTNPVWPPVDFGSDYIQNTENYIFLSYGVAAPANIRKFEIKATRNSSSRLYYSDNGIDQNETEAWLQMVRVGDTVVCLRKHSETGDWLVENRYPNPDHPFPDFGATLQVGITAYTDWATASPYSGSVQNAYHFNYAPQLDGNPDLISQVDYYRFRRPDPTLTEAVLQGMATSYNPTNNSTASPPVTLAASPTAAPYLGDQAGRPYDPFLDWQNQQFGSDAALPLATPAADPDGDGMTNLEEFVLGGDPQNPASTPTPTVEFTDPPTFGFTFTPAIDNGAQIEIQISTDLDQWDTLSTRPLRSSDWTHQSPDHTLTVNPITGAVQMTLPNAGVKTFARLRLTL